jgi:hypothetical protein
VAIAAARLASILEAEPSSRPAPFAPNQPKGRRTAGLGAPSGRHQSANAPRPPKLAKPSGSPCGLHGGGTRLARGRLELLPLAAGMRAAGLAGAPRRGHGASAARSGLAHSVKASKVEGVGTSKGAGAKAKASMLDLGRGRVPLLMCWVRSIGLGLGLGLGAGAGGNASIESIGAAGIVPRRADARPRHRGTPRGGRGGAGRIAAPATTLRARALQASRGSAARRRRANRAAPAGSGRPVYEPRWRRGPRRPRATRCRAASGRVGRLRVARQVKRVSAAAPLVCVAAHAHQRVGLRRRARRGVASVSVRACVRACVCACACVR